MCAFYGLPANPIGRDKLAAIGLPTRLGVLRARSNRLQMPVRTTPFAIHPPLALCSRQDTGLCSACTCKSSYALTISRHFRVHTVSYALGKPSIHLPNRPSDWPKKPERPRMYPFFIKLPPLGSGAGLAPHEASAEPCATPPLSTVSPGSVDITDPSRSMPNPRAIRSNSGCYGK